MVRPCRSNIARLRTSVGQTFLSVNHATFSLADRNVCPTGQMDNPSELPPIILGIVDVGEDFRIGNAQFQGIAGMCGNQPPQPHVIVAAEHFLAIVPGEEQGMAPSAAANRHDNSPPAGQKGFRHRVDQGRGDRRLIAQRQQNRRTVLRQRSQPAAD